MVVMWWVTLCLIGCSLLQGHVTAGKSARIASYSFLGFVGRKVGLGEES